MSTISLSILKKTNYKKTLYTILCLAALFLSTSTSLAKVNVTDNQVNTIADKLRCPTCQGLSVKESQAGLSINMKKSIRSMLEQGKSETEILIFFKNKYGEWILRNPIKSGWNWILWLAPLAFLFIFGYFTIYYLYKNSSISTKITKK